MDSEFRILNIEIRNVFVFVLITLMTHVGYSQNSPILKFRKDNVLIGELTPVVFTYKHNSNEEVLFADSAYDFSPFEFEKIEVYSTETVDSISVDSVVYWFTTFELDIIQTLRIPVFVYLANDSIPVFSNIDSIRLTEVIPVMSDTLKVKENTNLQEVESEFNYPIFSIVLGGGLCLGLILILIFRKKIVLFFKLKMMKKQYLSFLNDIDKSTQNFLNDESNDNLEILIIIWKSYLEKLKSEPFTKLSSKELETLIENEKVVESLKKADGMLFGNIKFENPFSQIEDLKKYAEQEYAYKVDFLKNERGN